MKGILIIMCIAFAWWCVSSFGVAGLLLFILGFQSFLFSFFIFCIFAPETWWDNTAKIKGEELKIWINKTFKK